jgi:hypothetical protein
LMTAVRPSSLLDPARDTSNKRRPGRSEIPGHRFLAKQRPSGEFDIIDDRLFIFFEDDVRTTFGFFVGSRRPI